MSLAERLKAMPPELRNAGIAAAALVASMILPWYQKSFVPPGAHQFTQANLSAFGVFSFIEAAVLVVAAGVLFLVWARTNRRAFHLPGGDGAVITAAGTWALVLLVWRLFDKPDAAGPSATIGIQWGIFGAMLAAGALVAAGARVRAVHRPEPPNPAADDLDFERPARRRAGARADRRPRDPGAVTEVLRDRPAWEGDPPDSPRRSAGQPPDAPTERLDDSRPPRRRNGAGDPPATDRLF
ncbi:MAG: hypothetical protein QOK21_3830 [Solirubrobacteraceae bacterium]|jgi:hypothetical protein|nr:hypothetical protein [Solirubrobacteraceae bacterium]